MTEESHLSPKQQRQATIMLFAAARASMRAKNDPAKVTARVTDADIIEAADDVALMETILGAKP